MFGVLLRFRVFNVAVVGDIEKAFLQISFNSGDRDYVRFLWFSDVHKINFSNFESNKFVEYRFCRELFGVVPYPFLLPTTIISHITHLYHLDPKFIVSLLNSLYVDDLNSGAHTIGEALEFFVKCKEGSALGRINLRKFRSNSKELENLVVEKFHEEISNENAILGLQWDKSSDEIICDVNKICKNIPAVITKHSIIQFLVGIYDPLSLINPLIVELKVLFQDMCFEKHN